ncbi:MAG: hypothetical protein AMXMBFR13_25330 [Phycisphaerae bacterium]
MGKSEMDDACPASLSTCFPPPGSHTCQHARQASEVYKAAYKTPLSGTCGSAPSVATGDKHPLVRAREASKAIDAQNNSRQPTKETRPALPARASNNRIAAENSAQERNPHPLSAHLSRPTHRVQDHELLNEAIGSPTNCAQGPPSP